MTLLNPKFYQVQCTVRRSQILLHCRLPTAIDIVYSHSKLNLKQFLLFYEMSFVVCCKQQHHYFCKHHCGQVSTHVGKGVKSQKPCDFVTKSRICTIMPAIPPCLHRLKFKYRYVHCFVPVFAMRCHSLKTS